MTVPQVKSSSPLPACLYTSDSLFYFEYIHSLTHVKNSEGLDVCIIRLKLKVLLKNIKYIFVSCHQAWVAGDCRISRIFQIPEEDIIIPPPALSTYSISPDPLDTQTNTIPTEWFQRIRRNHTLKNPYPEAQS